MTVQMHRDHAITVTGGGPFGRAWFDCSCGIAHTFAALPAANAAALRHLHETAGCTCPPHVVASPLHPTPASSWHGLGTPSQIALSWAVRVGGKPYVSDLPSLRGLERDGLVREAGGAWFATEKGRDVHDHGKGLR